MGWCVEAIYNNFYSSNGTQLLYVYLIFKCPSFSSLFLFLSISLCMSCWCQIIEARGHRVPIVIVGNKADAVERKFPREITETMATLDWECGYCECSAKENFGIVDVFKELLVQAKIRYNLSPAVRRRRQSLPSYSFTQQQQQQQQQKLQSAKTVLKRHSCTVA